MSADQTIITVSLECVELPAPIWGGHHGIWVGIQAGDDVIQRIQLPAESVTFTAEFRVGNDPSEPQPNFLGPYAHGPKGGRFLYICWGVVHLGQWVGFRRAKLPLQALSWDVISKGEVRATLRCTDPKGGPVCATVKPPALEWTA